LRVREKRVKLRYGEDVKEEEVHLSKKLADELGIKEHVVIAIPGRKNMEFRAVINDKVPYGEVWANSSVMKARGVADGSVVTVRGY